MVVLSNWSLPRLRFCGVEVPATRLGERPTAEQVFAASRPGVDGGADAWAVKAVEFLARLSAVEVASCLYSDRHGDRGSWRREMDDMARMGLAEVIESGDTYRLTDTGLTLWGMVRDSQTEKPSGVILADAGAGRTDEPTSRWETITPADATEALGRSRIVNRNLRHDHIRRMADEMQKGVFQPNGETVIFDDEGNVMDGHHRLHACVKAGVPFRSLVVRGVPSRFRDGIDGGLSRTAGDRLTMRQVKYANDVKVIARYHWGMVNGRLSRMSQNKLAAGFTTDEMIRVVSENQSAIEDAAARGGKLARDSNKLLPPSIFGFGLFSLATFDREKAERFCEQVAKGVNLSEDDPAYRLRALVMPFAVKGSAKKLTELSRMAYLLKAWRAFCHGKPMKTLRWAENEEFPNPDPNVK